MSFECLPGCGYIGKEPHIQPLGEEYGTVVYHYQPKTDLKLFAKSLLKSRSARRPPLPTDLASDSLVFESRFESGNLLQVTVMKSKIFYLSEILFLK